MGFWGSLGKIALQAAPYVAAPFTGGASLYAVPATQKLGQKWSEHDNAERAKKGLGPSNFDKYLNLGSNIASLASGTGALGKFGSAAYTAGKAGTATKALSGWQNRIKQGGQVASMAMGGSPYAGAQNYTGNPRDYMENGGIAGRNPDGTPSGRGLGGWEAALGGLGGMFGGGGQSQQAPFVPSINGTPLSNQGQAQPRNQYDVGNAINRGRTETLMNQPWRTGYNTVIEDEDQLITTPMPPIYPNLGPPQSNGNGGVSSFQQAVGSYGDELTPRSARKRYPSPAEEEY